VRVLKAGQKIISCSSEYKNSGIKQRIGEGRIFQKLILNKITNYLIK